MTIRAAVGRTQICVRNIGKTTAVGVSALAGQSADGGVGHCVPVEPAAAFAWSCRSVSMVRDADRWAHGCVACAAGGPVRNCRILLWCGIGCGEPLPRRYERVFRGEFGEMDAEWIHGERLSRNRAEWGGASENLLRKSLDFSSGVDRRGDRLLQAPTCRCGQTGRTAPTGGPRVRAGLGVRGRARRGSAGRSRRVRRWSCLLSGR